MDDAEKSQLGNLTFLNFCQQFGNDEHSLILLEEILKGVMFEEALFIFGEQIEAGNQAGDGAPERIDSDIPIDGFEGTQSSSDLAEEDFTDYP